MKKFCLAAIVMLVMPQGWAQQCDPAIAQTAPAARFAINADGTVTDTQTDLMWMRCALGQAWRTGRCVFGHETYDFYAAAGAAEEANGAGGFAGHRDWRLPTLEELLSIVERRCFDPALNGTVFPANPVTGYWSSTPDHGYSSGAMLVHTLNGHGYMGNKKGYWALRLVRDSR